MKKTQNKGFTLVELIIVITILAILATIAFVSFSGYAGQSRDAKKQSELSNLKNKVEVSIAANSQDVLSFVSGSSLEPSTLPSFAGKTVVSGTDYKGGTINYATLGAESSKYKFTYGIGAVKNTGGSFYQMVTKLEDGNNYTVGNYSPRTAAVVTATEVTANQKFTLTGSSIGKFRVGDTLASAGLVTKVSSDLSTVETSGTVTYSNGGIALAAPEASILIDTTSLSK